MVKENESVAGWPSPPERVLRFPVELRGDARLSVRLGGFGDVAAQAGDAVFRVEYSSVPPSSDRSPSALDSIAVFESTPLQSSQCFSKWEDVDVPLARCPPGSGELRFVVEGPLAEDPGVNLFWGQPAVYYPRERRHRNVLLIGVDTLRMDAASPFGGRGDLTPNLQEFSRTATSFPRTWSQCPWTLPSFSSMLTGRLPSSIGATMLSWQLPDRAVGIGEMLLPYGWSTGTVCSNTYLGNSSSGFHQGMEGLWYQYNVPAVASIQKAMDFINRSKDRDWFCFLHFQDPHTPYEPPREFAERFCDPLYQGPYKWSFRDDGKWKFSDEIPREEDIRQARGLYDAEVAYLDQSLAALFDFLVQNDLADETLVIFAADHGEEFYEHGKFEHGQSHFEEEVHVPLMIAGEGFPAGERIETSVGNFDIVPTILRYLGLPSSDNLAGVPLQDVVAGAVPEERVIFGEDNIRGTQRKFAVRWPYKCVLDFVTGQTVLFDLEADPNEMNDIADSNPDIVDDLSRRIISAMLPEESTFHVWFMGSFVDEPRRFTGTLRVPGGIRSMQAFGLTGDDEAVLEGDTVRFAITNANPEATVDKHITIVPAPAAETLEIALLVDGFVDPDRFFPYGTMQTEPSGFATVDLDDFPLVPDIPTGEQAIHGACHVWGVRGFGGDVQRAEMDEESLEQLRALGYIQ